LRLECFGETVAGVLTDLQRRFDGKSEEVGKLRFALHDRLMVSARRSALSAVEETRQLIASGQRMVNAVGLMEAIVDRFCDAATRVSEELADKIDGIED
jgi:Mg2+ and Co2+ transporter CorA